MVEQFHSKSIIKFVTMGTIVSLMALSANAAVTLNVDDNIKVTAINGNAVNTSLLQPMKKTFTLTPGQHVITARYDRIYELRNDDHDYLKSNNLTVKANMQDNQNYRLTMLGQPERYQEAREYVKRPTLAIQQGNQILDQQSKVQEDSSIIASIGTLFGKEDAVAQNQTAIESINHQPGITANQAPNSIPNTTYSSNNVNSQPAHSSSVLDNFMKIWLQATPEEREKIRQWVQK